MVISTTRQHTTVSFLEKWARQKRDVLWLNRTAQEPEFDLVFNCYLLLPKYLEQIFSICFILRCTSGVCKWRKIHRVADQHSLHRKMLRGVSSYRRLRATMALLVVLLMLIFTGSKYKFVDKEADKFNGPKSKFMENWEMDDYRLIDYIRENILEPPDLHSLNLTNPSVVDYSQYQQSTKVAQFFKHKRFGTFVEAGAFDGESMSNSLYFEKSLGWRGILVEPILFNQQKLRFRHRKSFFLPGCLAGKYPYRVRFNCPGGEMSHCTSESNLNSTEPSGPLESWCFPLFSVLSAANLTRVDYLVLDLEGLELSVLEAIPFDKLSIKLIQIESVIPGQHHLDPHRSATFRNFFKTNWPQYEELNTREYQFQVDIVFVNKEID